MSNQNEDSRRTEQEVTNSRTIAEFQNDKHYNILTELGNESFADGLGKSNFSGGVGGSNQTGLVVLGSSET